MKHLISVLLFLSVTFSSLATNVTVTFTHLRKPTGSIIIGVYDSPKNFPKDEGQLIKTTIPVNSKSVTTTLNLAPGEYAFAICHDEDGDGTCNQNFLGIPKEGFAFSNNFKPRLRAPKFDDVKIVVGEEDMEIEIKLLYF